MDKYCEESILNERRNRIKLIINIEKDRYEMIKQNVEHGQDYEYFKIIANGIPYEERPQGEWIPVSERLPKYSGLYLISIYDLVTVANFTGKYFCDRQMDKFVDVMAWQPLPKPYKKGGAE